MTPVQRQSLTKHLAEKVCGWKLKEDMWIAPSGERDFFVAEFAPLTCASDTALVMKAWTKSGGTLEIRLGSLGYSSEAYNRGACRGFSASMKDDEATSWTEAVCLAIGLASGWEKI